MENLEVENNQTKNQFEANLNGKTTLINYRKEASENHSEVSISRGLCQTLP